MSLLQSIGSQLNPFSTYARLRRENPVYYDSFHRNWNLFRYDDVQQALSDYNVFSSQFIGEGQSNEGMPFAASMIGTDPPRHRQLRALVTQAFTPRAVEALAPRIQAIVKEYLDRVTSEGNMDIIADLGYPLPVIVISELLGVPAEDREKFKHWSDIIVSLAEFNDNIDPQKFQEPAVLEMSAYFFQMIEQRRQSPQDDLISGLLAANIGGETLSMIELLGFCALLLVAGNETTTNLIGNAVHTFAEQPEVWTRLRAEPDLVPQAIEEVLRFRSPVQSMFRVTKSEVTIAGATIPARVPVVAWIGSANHDEDQFPDPERFDLDRNPNRHLAFGQGIHYCLGAPLARLEAKIALSMLLERFRTVELHPDAHLQRLPSLLVFGLRSLPVRFQLA